MSPQQHRQGPFDLPYGMWLPHYRSVLHEKIRYLFICIHIISSINIAVNSSVSFASSYEKDLLSVLKKQSPIINIKRTLFLCGQFVFQVFLFHFKSSFINFQLGIYNLPGFFDVFQENKKARSSRTFKFKRYFSYLASVSHTGVNRRPASDSQCLLKQAGFITIGKIYFCTFLYFCHKD